MNTSRWSKMLGILPLTLALAGLAGCANNPDVEEESSDVAASELAGSPGKNADKSAAQEKPEQARGSHGKHARGPAFLLGAALRELTLTDAQKTAIQNEIDALQNGAKEPSAAHEASRKELAAAVRSGKVDEAAFSKQLAPEPFDQARLAKAVTVLHDVLDATQRKQLVDAVLAKMEKKGKHGDHAGKRGEKGDDESGGSGRGGRGRDRGDHGGKHGADGEHEMRGPMGHLLKGIELTDMQREGVREAFAKSAPSEAEREAMKAKHEAGKKAMRERMESFASDRFDANAFVAMPADMPRGGPDGMFGGMVQMLAKVAPILDETQRAELARRIEEGPPAHGFKGKGRHGK